MPHRHRSEIDQAHRGFQFSDRRLRPAPNERQQRAEADQQRRIEQQAPRSACPGASPPLAPSETTVRPITPWPFRRSIRREPNGDLEHPPHLMQDCSRSRELTHFNCLAFLGGGRLKSQQKLQPRTPSAVPLPLPNLAQNCLSVLRDFASPMCTSMSNLLGSSITFVRLCA